MREKKGRPSFEQSFQWNQSTMCIISRFSKIFDEIVTPHFLVRLQYMERHLKNGHFSARGIRRENNASTNLLNIISWIYSTLCEAFCC